MNEFALKVLMSKNGKTYLFSVGQAGFIIKSKNGQLLGIDLYLSDCVERIEGNIGFKRLLPKLLSPSDLEFDCIVATHPHYDHFDFDSMPELMSNNRTRLYASVNCVEEIKMLKISQKHITYVKPGDKSTIGDYKLSFIPCDHGTAAPDAIGLLIEVDKKKLYIAGDTSFHTEEAEQFIKEYSLDVLIAPINGRYGNLNEEECANLSRKLNPKLTIPCHYGMFAAHGGDPGVFMKRMEENCPENKYFLMTLGERLQL